jgi:hypothetical protein
MPTAGMCGPEAAGARVAADMATTVGSVPEHNAAESSATP